MWIEKDNFCGCDLINCLFDVYFCRIYQTIDDVESNHLDIMNVYFWNNNCCIWI